jgi:hypothetical protein
MSFETIFITEGPDGTPAAEIQFNQQRLCLVRFLAAGAPQIEFVQDLYVERAVVMAFPLQQFQETIQQATDDLASWQQNLADDRSEA